MSLLRFFCLILLYLFFIILDFLYILLLNMFDLIFKLFHCRLMKGFLDFDLVLNGILCKNLLLFYLLSDNLFFNDGFLDGLGNGLCLWNVFCHYLCLNNILIFKRDLIYRSFWDCLLDFFFRFFQLLNLLDFLFSRFLN